MSHYLNSLWKKSLGHHEGPAAHILAWNQANNSAFKVPDPMQEYKFIRIPFTFQKDKAAEIGMCMYKTAIIRYKSSLNDKYVAWNICFEHVNQTIWGKSFAIL